MIAKCTPTCSARPHTQDELHGKGMRVLNERPKKDNDKFVIVSCTVCGSTQEKVK